MMKAPFLKVLTGILALTPALYVGSSYAELLFLATAQDGKNLQTCINGDLAMATAIENALPDNSEDSQLFANIKEDHLYLQKDLALVCKQSDDVIKENLRKSGGDYNSLFVDNPISRLLDNEARFEIALTKYPQLKLFRFCAREFKNAALKDRKILLNDPSF